MELKFQFKFNNGIWYWTKKFHNLSSINDDRIIEYLENKIQKSDFFQSIDLKLSDIKIQKN